MTELYGVMAEFAGPAAVVAATLAARQAGLVALEVHGPMPVDGLDAALGLRSRLSVFTFLGGLLGGGGILGFMIWAQAFDWTLDIGGRHAAAITAFIVPTFALTILGAGLTTAAAMFVGNRLPALYHPVFNVPAFARASQDRFFLVVEARDPAFVHADVRRLLSEQDPIEVYDVPR